MKDILLALNNYKAINGDFPPAVVYDQNGKPMHSWRVFILPYLDETQLFERYDFDEAWDSPKNLRLLEEMPDVFRCPGHGHHGDELGQEYTNYVLIKGDDSAFPSSQNRNENLSLIRHREGIVLTDVNHRSVVWTSPFDITVDSFMKIFSSNDAAFQEESNHAGFLVTGYADGAVQVVSTSADLPAVRELLRVDASEPNESGNQPNN